MNKQFDELTRKMAQSVTRRDAVKQFGLGLAGLVLAALGQANQAQAAKGGGCNCAKADFGCLKKFNPADPNYSQLVSACLADCQGYCDCKKNPWGC
jgi:hypothetical protein